MMTDVIAVLAITSAAVPAAIAFLDFDGCASERAGHCELRLSGVRLPLLGPCLVLNAPGDEMVH